MISDLHSLESRLISVRDRPASSLPGSAGILAGEFRSHAPVPQARDQRPHAQPDGIQIRERAAQPLSRRGIHDSVFDALTVPTVGDVDQSIPGLNRRRVGKLAGLILRGIPRAMPIQRES